jgi:hypothetical protein
MTQGIRSRDAAFAGELTARPQPEQNRALGDSEVPQEAHGAPARGAPQLAQNFPLPGSPQVGQEVGAVLVTVTKRAECLRRGCGARPGFPGVARP